MFPTDDNEFWILYLTYILLFIILFIGAFVSKIKNFYRNNLIIYLFYTAIMVFVFVDKSYLEGVSSLLVLFFGGLFVLAHFVILCGRLMYKKVFRK